MPRRNGYRWRKDRWQPSPAQQRVLDGLAAGQTNAELAVRLGLSPETVKWHISQLLAETGCADRQALAAWWQADRRHGLALLPLLLTAGRVARGTLLLGAVGLLALLVVLGLRHGRPGRLSDTVPATPALLGRTLERTPTPTAVPPLVPAAQRQSVTVPALTPPPVAVPAPSGPTPVPPLVPASRSSQTVPASGAASGVTRRYRALAGMRVCRRCWR